MMYGDLRFECMHFCQRLTPCCALDLENQPGIRPANRSVCVNSVLAWHPLGTCDPVFRSRTGCRWNGGLRFISVCIFFILPVFLVQKVQIGTLLGKTQSLCGMAAEYLILYSIFACVFR